VRTQPVAGNRFSEPAHDLAAWGRESAGWAATPPAAQQTENRAGNQE
jgi:hypothetical protein